MTSQVAQVVQRQLEAYNNRDIDAFMALFSDDATLLSFPGDQVLAKGKAQVKEVYQKLFESSPRTTTSSTASSTCYWTTPTSS